MDCVGACLQHFLAPATKLVDGLVGPWPARLACIPSSDFSLDSRFVLGWPLGPRGAWPRPRPRAPHGRASHRLRELDAQYQGWLKTVASNKYEIAKSAEDADLVMGSLAGDSKRRGLETPSWSGVPGLLISDSRSGSLREFQASTA